MSRLGARRSEDKLTDELLGDVIDAVRPGRRPGDHGESREALRAHEDFIKGASGKEADPRQIHSQLHCPLVDAQSSLVGRARQVSIVATAVGDLLICLPG